MSQYSQEVLVDNPVTISSGNITVDGTVAVSNFPATQPVSGPLTDTQLRATPVPVSFTAGSVNTATVSRVAVSTTVTTLLASVPARTKFIIYNETGTLFVKLGTGAADTDYTTRLTANTIWEYSGYSGIVTATKLSGSTFTQVTSI